MSYGNITTGCRRFESGIAHLHTDIMEQQFLNLLEKDIKQNPQRLELITEALAEKLLELVGDLEVDLNEKLTDDDDP